jgi:hypothetical protein
MISEPVAETLARSMSNGASGVVDRSPLSMDDDLLGDAGVSGLLL